MSGGVVDVIGRSLASTVEQAFAFRKMLTGVVDLSAASGHSIPVLAIGGSGTSENDRRKEKQKSEKSSEAVYHFRLEKGIRRRRKTLFEDGGLSFDMHICS